MPVAPEPAAEPERRGMVAKFKKLFAGFGGSTGALTPSKESKAEPPVQPVVPVPVAPTLLERLQSKIPREREQEELATTDPAAISRPEPDQEPDQEPTTPKLTFRR